MKPIHKVWNLVLAMSRPVLFGVIGILLVLVLLTYRLGTLTPGLSAPEVATYESANTISEIVNNTVNAPYKTAVFFTTKVLHNAWGLRLVSAGLGAMTIGLFYLLSRRLFSPTDALATTILFGTSALFLHVARLGTADVMLFSVLALICAGYMLRFAPQQDLVWPVSAAIIALSLYVPGMVFFIIPAVVWQFWHLRKSFEQLKPFTIALCATIVGFLLAPLVISLIREPSLWHGYTGLPSTFVPISEMLHNMGKAAASLFVFSSLGPVYWLGRAPILDVFTIVLFIFGVFYLIQRFRLDRLWLMAGTAIITLLWIGVSGNLVAISALLPFVFLVCGFGLYTLMDEWLKVFPRNPIARMTGLVLMTAVVALSVNFQLQRYFAAWPNNTEVKAVFNQQLP